MSVVFQDIDLACYSIVPRQPRIAYQYSATTKLLSIIRATNMRRSGRLSQDIRIVKVCMSGPAFSHVRRHRANSLAQGF